MASPKLKPKGFLKSKITDPAISREVSALTEAVSTIAGDNKTPFFPAYTDHGIDHLQAVLDWCVKLTPKGAKRVLGENDAAVIIGGALLHDVAMHLHVPGFIDLVGGDWPSPLPWFDEPHGRRPADRPWDEMWDDFKAEARHFDHVEIVRLLGSDHAGSPKIVFEEDIRRATLDEFDKLYVGEFLRRHHARLAHEIALYGFPGLSGTFPRPAVGLPTTLRDLMGLVARSHNEDLRLIVDHMKEHRGSTRRGAVHVPFAAALLRIADFAQLDFQRAPSLLLRMAAPQSQISIDEWAKHQAVELVGEDGEDPDAIRIEVSSDIRLHTYLQLEELFEGLQHELDTCSAVLSEVYGSTRGLAPLRLTKRRLRHNMASPEFRAALPFVPRESRLRSAEDMFRLVVDDLYGNSPWVAGRELIQNALDAVRERRRMDEMGGEPPSPDPDWPDPDDRSVDVLVEVVLGDDDRITLRVADRGVGMTADTIVDYYLEAGASLGPSPRELEEVPVEDVSRFVKIGRFGIGALASFLIGDEVTITTRHVRQSSGLRFSTRFDSSLIPITRFVVAPVGTEVSVPVTEVAAQWLATNSADYASHPNERGSAERAALNLARWCRDICVTSAPKVRVRVDVRGAVEDLDGGGMDEAADRWVDFDVDRADVARWALARGNARIACNGVVVRGTERHVRPYAWSSGSGVGLHRPDLLLTGPTDLIELTIDRFRLRTGVLAFETRLLESMARELVAGALIGRGAVADAMLLGRGPTVQWPGGSTPNLPGLRGRLGGRIAYQAIVIPNEWGWKALFDRPGEATFDHAIDGMPTQWLMSDEPGQAWEHDFRPRLEEYFGSRFDGSRRRGARIGLVPSGLAGDRKAVSRFQAGLVDAGDALPRRRLLERAEIEHLAPSVRRMLPARGWTAVLVAQVAVEQVGETAVPVTDVWMNMVGQPIPHDDEARLRLADRVYDEHPEIRPHMERQRRIAAEGADRSG